MKRIIFGLSLVFSAIFAIAQPAAPSGKQWQVVPELTDEFNFFDGNKWQKNHPYWSGRWPSQYNSNNVSIVNGNLALKMSVKNANRQGTWIWAAAVTSKTRAFKKGMYAEAKVKIANLSAVTAFWMQEPTYSEIDVIENWGTVKNNRWRYLDYTMESNTHSFTNSFETDRVTPKHFTNPGNVRNADRYWTYGVWWKDAKTIIYYRDGVEVGRATPHFDFNDPMYMFFDMEPFTWGPGLPSVNDLNNNSINTSFFEFVRTYRLVDGGGSSPPSGSYPLVTLRKENAQNYGFDGGNGGSNGQNLYLWQYNPNNVNQQWVEIDRGNGFYSYKKKSTNYCIDGRSGGVNGQNVHLWACNVNNQNQHWRKVSLGNNRFRLQKRNASQYSIDGNNGGNNLQNVHIWENSNSNGNQRLIITTVGMSN